MEFDKQIILSCKGKCKEPGILNKMLKKRNIGGFILHDFKTQLSRQYSAYIKTDKYISRIK
jgi:hypothetical protein